MNDESNSEQPYFDLGTRMITRDIRVYVPNGTHDEVDIQENKEHSDVTAILFLVRKVVINHLCRAVGREGGEAVTGCEQLEVK